MLAAAAPAEAKIVCVKGYQIVNGSPIATPYCQDTLVAQVAAEHDLPMVVIPAGTRPFSTGSWRATPVQSASCTTATAVCCLA